MARVLRMRRPAAALRRADRGARRPLLVAPDRRHPAGGQAARRAPCCWSSRTCTSPPPSPTGTTCSPQGRVVETLDNAEVARPRAGAARLPRHLTPALIPTTATETACARTSRVMAVAATTALLRRGCGGAAAPAAARGKITDDKIVLGRAQRPVRRLRRAVRQEQRRGGADGDRRLQGQVRRQGRDKNIEVVTADHQNKPDIANTKAQELYDRQEADAILDVPTSSAALAVADVAKAEEEALLQHRRRHHRADRQAVQQVHVPLRLRHLHAGQRHRHDGHRAGRRRTGTSSTRTTRSGRTWRRASPPRSRRPAARSSRQDADAVPEPTTSPRSCSRRRR